jgi:hypothetical protein
MQSVTIENASYFKRFCKAVEERGLCAQLGIRASTSMTSLEPDFGRQHVCRSIGSTRLFLHERDRGSTEHRPPNRRIQFDGEGYPASRSRYQDRSLSDTSPSRKKD